jgi:hypothetical protein
MKKVPELDFRESTSSSPNSSLNKSFVGDKVGFILDGRYELLEGLGNVRSTKVYLVRDLLNNSKAVIKFDGNSLEHEYDILSALNHDRIITCH